MKKKITKILAFMLILCLSVAPICPVSAATPQDEIMPCYNNTVDATANLSVNDNGVLTITYQYAGYQQYTTSAVITTYIERKTLGLFWTRVDNGQPDNQWVDTIYSYKYSGDRNFQLPKKGTYRVTVIFKIFGSLGPSDEIEGQATVTY